MRKKIKELLRQGTGPEQLAASISLGAVIGLLPIPGIPTPLCLLVAARWKLNHAAIQIANWLTYPAYFPSVYGFGVLGHRLLGGPPMTLALSGFWRAASYVVFGWLVTAPFFLAAFYFSLKPLLRRWSVRWE